MKNEEQRLIEGLLIINENPMCRRVMDILYEDGRTGYDGLLKKTFGKDPSKEEEAVLDKAIMMLRRKKMIGKIRKEHEVR